MLLNKTLYQIIANATLTLYTHAVKTVSLLFDNFIIRFFFLFWPTALNSIVPVSFIDVYTWKYARNPIYIR